MRAGKQATAKAASWSATGPFTGRMLAYRSQRLRREDQRSKATALVMALSSFLVILVVALLIGGRALIEPLLWRAATDGQTSRTGAIVFAMPDGTFCRHLSFDNQTAALTEGAIEQCTPDGFRGRWGGTTGFSWGAH